MNILFKPYKKIQMKDVDKALLQGSTLRSLEVMQKNVSSKNTNTFVHFQDNNGVVNVV